MKEAIIRPATDDDLEAIKDIAVAAWEPIYRSFRELMGHEIFDSVYKNWPEDKAGQVERHYKGYPECTLVTEYDGVVVGFITYNLFEQKKLGVIGNNAIHPDYQGMGLGWKQHQKAVDIFRESGMLYAEVMTGSDKSHAPARASYEKVGFSPRIHMVRYYMEL